MGGVADPKIHITPTCYHLKFGSSATKLGSAETRPLGVGAWLTNQEQAPSPYVLPRQKWWFCVKGVWINSREPPKLGSAWVPPFTVGKIDDPRNKSLHTCVILSSVVVLDQTVRALLRRSAWKIWPSCPAFQGHSRSSELTGINPPRAAYDFLLIFHSNHGPISYRFWDKR